MSNRFLPSMSTLDSASHPQHGPTALQIFCPTVISYLWRSPQVCFDHYYLPEILLMSFFKENANDSYIPSNHIYPSSQETPQQLLNSSIPGDHRYDFPDLSVNGGFFVRSLHRG
jgi:hypothetical protein